MKSRLLPSGKLLNFNIEKHTYSVASRSSVPDSKVSTGGDDVLCTSVSAVLDKCFPFDSEGVSTKVASKSPFDVLLAPGDAGYGSKGTFADGKIKPVYRQKTPKEVKDEWTSRASLGSNVHAFIEQKIQKLPLSPRIVCQGEEHLYYPTADVAASEVLKEYDPVEIELMIASPSLGLAGTIDFLGRNKKTGGLIVGDWKTSSASFSEYKHFSFDRPSNEELDLGFLVNEKSRRYALQILIYGHLLEREGYLAKYDQPLLPSVNSHSFGKAKKKNHSASTMKKAKKGPHQLATAPHYLPLEFGIIQMSKNLDGTVGVQFKKITPSAIVPFDLADEVTSDDVIRSLIGF